ncbi:2,3-bisphosphoglycerate-independent phosphoglycerate mutase [Candidatus Dependentiae bacterium]
MKTHQYKPTMLIILDGFGYNPKKENNAVATANMPNFKKWLTIYPNCLLNASGKAVGLPSGYMGNSEVGHSTIGSGRITETILSKFNQTIENKSFFDNKLLIKKFEYLKNHNKNLHLMGLLSDSGVHSHQSHLFALIELAHKLRLKKVFVHAFLDGRDTPPKSALNYLSKLDTIFKKFNCGKLATLHGRFYAMDRDKNWNRTQISYNTLCNKQYNFVNISWEKALQKSYTQNITDEFLEPIKLDQAGTIQKNDGVLFFNFRPDRANQLTECFINPKFNHFLVKDLNTTDKTLSFFITTTRYKKDFINFNNDILFKKEKIDHTLLDEISAQTHKPIFVIAETEKYAHVTYFFRGMSEKHLQNVIYTLIPSIKSKTYTNFPEMSAAKITSTVLESLRQNPAYFYLINYANPDMVGHSGDLNSTIKACEFLDKQLKKLYKEVVEKQNGTIFITSDHGNAEEMAEKHSTSHTNNPVIIMKINNKLNKNNLKLKSPPPEINYGLANIAPTILNHLGIKTPTIMEKPIIFS